MLFSKMVYVLVQKSSKSAVVAKWFKYEKPYMFWIAVAFLSIWIIKMLLKLFDR